MTARRRARSAVENFADEVSAAAGSALDRSLEHADRVGVELERRVLPVLELADRIDGLGPVGIGVLAWGLLPRATRESILGDVCKLCGEPSSRCECCGACGFSPCACPERFSIEVEGVSVD
jgi:hypothetical protein